MRWFAIEMIIGRWDGDLSMTVDVKAATPREATGRAILLACQAERVKRDLVAVVRCNYNDLRPLIQDAPDAD